MSLPLGEIVCGDALEVMSTFPDESIDLVVTSPPYNIRNSSGNGLKYGGKGKWGRPALLNGYEETEDNLPYPLYIEWQRACLSEMLRLIPDTGAIFYNHKWRVQHGLIQDRHEILDGFPVRQVIIWQRSGGFNFNQGYFLPTYEVIYLITKPLFKLAHGANRIGDVWTIKQEVGNPHPAPFPRNLTDRIIGSTDAQIILDPFAGSGTTCISAASLGRECIGIELSPKYCEMARRRLQEVQEVIV